MKHLLCVLLAVLTAQLSFSQAAKIKATKYPSLLWEITGKGATKPSYLFGTMHVSSKMVFNLSDSFYLGLKAAQVVALETNPGTWQEDFSRYDLEGEIYRNASRYRYGGYSYPQDYLSINTLKFTPYEKTMEAALYSNPSIINSFLYRSNSEHGSDFEEDTYLDLHIYQSGKKLGKRICGVEDFDGSMQLVKEAYADAAKEKAKKERSYDYDEDLSYRRLDEAYRTGNLDLLDTINKVNSQSAAFDEKFLYKRNEIQAASIDSILKRGSTLFVGVGAAHLPGERGVIEMLRRFGYKLRPIKMSQRDSRHKDEIEKLRVPVQFSKQTSEDGFYTVNTPGKLYAFGRSYNGAEMQQYADMNNGSYYMVTRILTNAALLGHNETQVMRKVDSVMYENIPGKILSKKEVVKNGYRGYEVTNRTRRGDHQRYNIFVTPYEIIIFKMSGNGDYVKLGTEAEQFFNSIQLKEYKSEGGGWKKFSPSSGGFEADFPHLPILYKGENWQYAAYDVASKTAASVVRTDIHNYSFLEEDSFDLNLMEESFASSDFVQRQLSRHATKANGYAALDVKYKYKDSSVALVRFLVQGPHYYTVVANSVSDNKAMEVFIKSFNIKPFVYTAAKKELDSALFFTVSSPVSLEKKKKLSMYPDGGMYGGYDEDNDDDTLIDQGKYGDKVIASDSTGQKIYVSFYKPSQFYYDTFLEKKEDSVERDDDDMYVRSKRIDTLANKTVVLQYELGSKSSGRAIRGKVFRRDGIVYELKTQIDTLSAPSAFVSTFFQTFSPVDTVTGVDVKKKKADYFFAQFFSKDTLQHKIAVKNIQNILLDSSDFPSLKKSIASLSWKEKKYLDIKKSLLNKMGDMHPAEVSDYLKAVYFAAGDTVELQYTALETLLQQQTSYSYKTFAGIMETDPPVLDFETENTTTTSVYNRYRTVDRYPSRNYDYSSSYTNGSFLDELRDSVQLTAGIFKNLLPLITVNDYENAMMELAGTLLDSSMIAPKDYEAYLPKFLIEAKQALKKQSIQEKAKAIQRAEKEGEEKKSYNAYEPEENDYGNSKLSQYATLLLPFWDTHTQVQPMINAMLNSNDKRLKYNTAILLLRNKRPLADTMLRYFAAMDEYRYELYNDLKELKMLNKFPTAYKNQLAIAKSQLLSEQSYAKWDTVAFIQKLPLQYKERNGYVYVFKYKEKKDDNAWRLATVGLLPRDENEYAFNDKVEKEAEFQYDFTETNGPKLNTESTEKEQLQKLLKKLLYSKRKSAVQFYSDESRYNEYDYLRMK